MSRRRDESIAVLAVGLFLVIIVWIVFGQTIRHGFINYDDGMYVYQNPDVLAGLTPKGIRWALTFAEIGHWHPITWFSHMLDASIWGRRAGGHHLTNVLLHIASAILLFLTLKQMTGALWRSAAVAAFFAVHPQRVESVAWIAERKDVLSGLFFMATILAYLRYTARPGLGRYAVVVILFALGLMSKGMLVTLPLVLLLLDYWPLARFESDSLEAKQHARNLLRLVGEKLPLLVLSVASCVITTLSPEKIAPVFQMPLFSRVESAVVSYVIYIKQLFYPVGLELPYFNPPAGFPAWEVVACVALLLGISAAAFLCWKRCPVLHCWLVLVSGNDVTSHRFGADLLLCAGRSLHLPPAYRPLSCDSMGSRRSDSRLGLASRATNLCRCACDWFVRYASSSPSFLLAR